MADVFLASIPQVIAALDVLYRDPDPNAKEKANAWLSAFQKAVSPTVLESEAIQLVWSVGGGRRSPGAKVDRAGVEGDRAAWERR